MSQRRIEKRKMARSRYERGGGEKEEEEVEEDEEEEAG